MDSVDLSQLPRLPGWEGRMADVLHAAHGQAYQLGTHDCFRMACAVIQAVVGIDRWPLFAGRYTTQRQCLALLAEHGHNFTEAGNWFFGSQPVGWKLARRGDLMEYRDDKGAHLVVCNGTHAVGLMDVGLVAVPLAHCEHAWRVG